MLFPMALAASASAAVEPEARTQVVSVKDVASNTKDITWGKKKAPRWPGAEFSHIDDEGFDDPWSMYCYNGGVFHLYEGQWSKNQCADVTHISVLAGRQVVCWDRTGDRRVFPPGVHYISGGSTYLRCVHQLT